MWMIEELQEKDGTRAWLVVVLLAAVALLLVVQWLRQAEQNQPTPPINLSVPATPAPEVKKQPKIEKPLKAKTVKVYPAAVKNNLKLPEIVAEDPAKEVVASSQVKADDHPQTITTLINTDTGEFETYAKRDPLPWFGTERRGEAGIILGLKNGSPAVRAEAHQTFAQVKAVEIGGAASVDQQLNGARETDWMVGVGAWYRW